MEFDKDQAIKAFVTRVLEFKGKEIDNARLRAGSPMHYYCHHCSIKTQTLPEEHRERPVGICEECKKLNENGVLTEAKEIAQSARYSISKSG